MAPVAENTAAASSPSEGRRPDIARISQSVDDTLRVARRLGVALEPGDVVLLVGDLGAGKTQFAKGVLEGLGSASEAISPTFNIMIEYDDGRIPLVHMDLYRLEDAGQLEDVDFYALTDEDADCACLIEWADMFPEEMPEDALEVRIERQGSDMSAGIPRTISISSSGPRSDRLISLLETDR